MKQGCEQRTEDARDKYEEILSAERLNKDARMLVPEPSAIDQSSNKFIGGCDKLR